MLWQYLSLVTAISAAKITDTKAAVRVAGEKGEPQYQGFATPVSLGANQVLDVRFKFDSEVPITQAFVSVKSPSGKYQGTNAKVRKNVARATVNFDGLEAGLSEARAYVSSPDGNDISAPLELTVLEGGAPAQKSSKFKQQNEVRYTPQPEIRHQFRAPPRYVSAPVAVVFAAAIWALLLVLVAAWNHVVGLSVGAVPFVASLAAIEAVFVGYYVSLSIFSAIFYSSILGGVAFVIGQRVLSADSLKNPPSLAAKPVPEIDVKEVTDEVKTPDSKKTKKTKSKK